MVGGSYWKCGIFDDEVKMTDEFDSDYEYPIYFIGPCTCEHGWGSCDVDGCECEAGYEE